MATANPIRKLFFLLIMSAAVTAAYPSGNFTRELGSSQYDLLQKELSRYFDVQSRGGWGKITAAKKYYMRGESAAAIQDVKKRLRATGQFRSDDTTPLFTEELAQAVKKAQKQFGLTATGSIDATLIKELNVPVERRIEQLQVNMERTRTSRLPVGGTTLIANIPEFKLHVYEGTNEVFDMAIVVGKESTKTVVFNDLMTHVIFSPYWNVPPSIVKNEILPAIRKNKSYLRNNGYEVIGTENGLPDIRQKPGAQNSLGRVKFVFPNDHNIYFHDTPAKSLFKMDKRAFSHGCIRLAEPAKLAAYLLKNDASWTTEKIEKAMQSGKEQTVKLSSPANVAITYFTAWVDDEGELNFREDIYGLDRDAAKSLMKVAQK